MPSRAKRVSGANRALHDALRELHAGGCRGLHLVHGADLLGSDGLGTVDGTHPTDVGFLCKFAAAANLLPKIAAAAIFVLQKLSRGL